MSSSLFSVVFLCFELPNDELVTKTYLMSSKMLFWQVSLITLDASLVKNVQISKRDSFLDRKVADSELVSFLAWLDLTVWKKYIKSKSNVS